MVARLTAAAQHSHPLFFLKFFLKEFCHPRGPAASGRTYVGRTSGAPRAIRDGGGRRSGARTSACASPALLSPRTRRGNGVRGRKQHASELLGGPGPFSPSALPRGTLALASSPKAGSAGVRAGGRGSHAPHRLLAIGMMHGCCRGFVSWVRCVYARMDC